MTPNENERTIMVLQLPESKRGYKQNLFEFRLHNNPKVYSIYKVQFLPLGIAEMLFSGVIENDDLEQKFTKAQAQLMIELIKLFNDDPELSTALDLDLVINVLLPAWFKESNFAVEKYPAS